MDTGTSRLLDEHAAAMVEAIDDGVEPYFAAPVAHGAC